MDEDLISLDSIYQYIEDTYALEGEEAKTLIESFIEYSDTGLAVYDSVRGQSDELQKLAIYLGGTAVSIGFGEFQQIAEKFEMAVQGNDESGREENYRLMVILLGRLKNAFKA